MSLLDALNGLKKDGFDPKTSKGTNFEDLPDGHYTASLTGATHNFKNNREFLMLTFTVETGQYKGRKQNIFPRLETVTSKGAPMPESVLKREIANLQILGECLNSPVPDTCFAHATTSEAYDDLADFFYELRGKRVKLTKKTKPNPRNPQYPYENFYFDKMENINPLPQELDENMHVSHETNKVTSLAEAAQETGLVHDDPFEASGETQEIDESQLPF